MQCFENRWSRELRESVKEMETFSIRKRHEKCNKYKTRILNTDKNNNEKILQKHLNKDENNNFYTFYLNIANKF